MRSEQQSVRGLCKQGRGRTEKVKNKLYLATHHVLEALLNACEAMRHEFDRIGSEEACVVGWYTAVVCSTFSGPKGEECTEEGRGDVNGEAVMPRVGGDIGGHCYRLDKGKTILALCQRFLLQKKEEKRYSDRSRN